MLAPGKGVSLGGTKNIPHALTERKSFIPGMFSVPAKLLLPSQLGSVKINNSRVGSFWKLMKFSPTFKGSEES